MKNIHSYSPFAGIIFLFFIMALASMPQRKTSYYSKPATYPCIRYPALTYCPILLRINIDASYTPKDLMGARETIPTLVLDALQSLNYCYKLADGVAPNLVMNITFNNDGYNHLGITLRVDWQGQATFSFTLPNNYITGSLLISDMAKKFNEYVIYGWHSGNCN